MMWVLLALAGEPDGALVREEGVVAEAAAAVARARQERQRPARVAELMAIYRIEAEKLAAMRPVDDPEAREGERDAALRALTDATARGAAAPGARAAVEAWLGPLDARVELLAGGLSAMSTSPAELAGPIALDVERQALAVRVAATYDAARLDADARDARTRAAALRASGSPLERPGLGVEGEIRELEAAAQAAATAAEARRAIERRAAQMQETARFHREER